MNRNETAAMLGVLKMLDRQDRVELNDITIDLWASLMADIPAAAGMAAVKRYMLHSKWFPAPSEIRDLVLQDVCGIPTVEDARRQVETALKRNYPGMPAQYTPDRIVLDTVREIGGIHMFRVSQSERDTADLWRRFTAKFEDRRRERMDTVDIAAAWQERQALPDSDRAAIGAGVNGEGDR